MLILCTKKMILFIYCFNQKTYNDYSGIKSAAAA